jgi:hypothetical protein
MRTRLTDWFFRLPAGIADPLQRALHPLLQTTHRIAERLADRCLPVRRADIEGARVALLGHLSDPLRFHFSMPPFPALIANPPESEVPQDQLSTALESLSREADLLYVFMGDVHGATPWRDAAFRVPLAVQSVLDLPKDREELIRQIRTRETRKEFNKFDRAGFAVEITRDPAVGKYFYEHFHVPWIRARHGSDALMLNPRPFLCGLREGELLLVKRNGEPVSGVLCRREGSVYRTDYSGVRDGDPRLVDDGALAAEYYFSIGISQPFLDNGILLFKKKWGGRLEPSHEDRRHLYLRIPRFSAPVARLLEAHPPILHGPDGLAGLVVVSESRRRDPEGMYSWLRYHACPGLSTLYLVTMDARAETRPADLLAALRPAVARPDEPLTPGVLFGPQTA